MKTQGVNPHSSAESLRHLNVGRVAIFTYMQVLADGYLNPKSPIQDTTILRTLMYCTTQYTSSLAQALGTLAHTAPHRLLQGPLSGAGQVPVQQ